MKSLDEIDKMIAKAEREGMPEPLVDLLRDLRNKAASVAKEDRDWKPVAPEVAEFFPIADLKVGDAVQWKSEAHKNASWPALGKPIYVSAVFPLSDCRAEDGQEVNRLRNFAALADCGDGDYVEFLFDSRRFKRYE